MSNAIVNSEGYACTHFDNSGLASGLVLVVSVGSCAKEVAWLAPLHAYPKDGGRYPYPPYKKVGSPCRQFSQT
jgi:hypothetical protein